MVRRWLWLLLPLAFFIMCAGWALTSPPGSSPDDDFHLTSIWCADGSVAGRCEDVPGEPTSRLVPSRVVNAASCFAFHPEVSAQCVSTQPTGLVATDRVNQANGLYPGLYYRVMGVLVGPDVEHSVLVMRLVNSAIAALLLALILRITPPGIRQAATVALAVTFVPLGLFLVPSTNPSGWAVVGLLAFWAFGLALVHRSDWRNRRTWLLAAATVVSGVMAVGSRVDAAAFVVLVAVVVGILAGWRRLRTNGAASALVAVVAVAGAITYLAHGTPAGGAEPGQAVQDAGLGHLLTNAVYLPLLVQQAVGFGALGWNDTTVPPLVPFVGVLGIGALAYAGLALLTVRKTAALIVTIAALIVVPLAFLQKEGLGVGEVVQPRYVLPLLALVLAVLGLGPRVARPLALARAPMIVLAAGLSVSAVLSFWANAHRYFAGTTVGLFDPKVAPTWVSSTGVPLWLTTLATGAASIAFVTGVLVTVPRTALRG